MSRRINEEEQGPVGPGTEAEAEEKKEQGPDDLTDERKGELVEKPLTVSPTVSIIPIHQKKLVHQKAKNPSQLYRDYVEGGFDTDSVVVDCDEETIRSLESFDSISKISIVNGEAAKLVANDAIIGFFKQNIFKNVGYSDLDCKEPTDESIHHAFHQGGIFRNFATKVLYQLLNDSVVNRDLKHIYLNAEESRYIYIPTRFGCFVYSITTIKTRFPGSNGKATGPKESHNQFPYYCTTIEAYKVSVGNKGDLLFDSMGSAVLTADDNVPQDNFNLDEKQQKDLDIEIGKTIRLPAINVATPTQHAEQYPAGVREALVIRDLIDQQEPANAKTARLQFALEFLNASTAVANCPNIALWTQAKNVIAAVEDEANRASPNYPKLTRVLNVSTRFVRNPNNERNSAALYKCAKSCRNWGIGKSVGLALLGLLGVGLIAASIAVAVVSFGGGTPLAALGIKAGMVILGFTGKALGGAAVGVASAPFIAEAGLRKFKPRYSVKRLYNSAKNDFRLFNAMEGMKAATDPDRVTAEQIAQSAEKKADTIMRL